MLVLCTFSQDEFAPVRGGFINHRMFHRHWRRVLSGQLGLNLRFHDLRHGYGSLLLAWGEPVLYVSQQLGHSSPL